MYVPYKNYVKVLYWRYSQKRRRKLQPKKLPIRKRVQSDKFKLAEPYIQDKLAIIPYLPPIWFHEIVDNGELLVIEKVDIPDSAYRILMNSYIRERVEVLSMMGYDVLGIIELIKPQLEYYADIEPDQWEFAISEYLYYFWNTDGMTDIDWAYFFMKCVRDQISDDQNPYQYLSEVSYTNYGYYNTHASVYYGTAPAYETLLLLNIDIPQLGLQQLLTGLIKRTIMRYDKAMRQDNIEAAGYWSLILHRLAKSYSELIDNPVEDYVSLLTDKLEMVPSEYKIFTPEELKQLPSPQDSGNSE